MNDSSRSAVPRASEMLPPRGFEPAGDSLSQWTPDVAPWRLRLDRAVAPRLEAGFAFVLARWALLVGLASALLVLGAYLSPLLKHLGYEGEGQALFAVYYFICAQTPGHSYFPWGFQAAIDQRMTAIYGSIVLAAPLYHWRGRSLRPLRWRLYLLLILPMALDGFTQAFGWRESTWELRTLTGVTFAVASVIAFFPRIDRQIWEFPR